MPNIKGYRNLSEIELNMINEWKETEKSIKHSLENSKREGADGRLAALAATHFETAFMYVVKAIAKPD